MLKNKIIVKKIRNILILFMSILIMIGAYHNVRRSRAENVIEISMEVADKNNSLEKQTVTIDATETKNGVYLAELPTSVNGNRVTKYYTSDGEELEIDPASVEKITLELTEDELANKKISLGTEYDKKTAIIDDVETTLYNKEFINEDGDVIVTGYMPLDVQLDFTEIDVNALKDIRLPSDDLTVKKSFGISIQEMIDVSKTTDKAETDDTTKTDGKNQVNDTTGLAENAQTNEIEKQLIEYDSTKYGEDITIKIKQADSKEETVIYSFSDGTPVTEVVYTNTDGILSFLKNDNDKFIYTVKKQETTDNVASEEEAEKAGFSDGSDEKSDSADTDSENKDSSDSSTTSVLLDTSKELTGIHHAEIEVKDYGTIDVELDADTAPITVTNFVKLAQEGFYDGLTFHRIMDGFMIQGGDPNGDGTGGSEENIKGEFSNNGVDNDISHTRGTISMARASDPDSASSQFFIVQADSTFLDGDYAGFGHVTEGMDIVDKICEDAKPTDDNGTIPSDQQPVIEKITITD